VSGSRVTTSRRPAPTVVRLAAASRRRRLRRVLYGFVAALAVVVTGGLAWLVAWSEVTELETVRIDGADGTLAERVSAAAEAPHGEQLIWIDTDAVSARVSQLAELASVSVHRSWPRTLVISVRQRTAAAAVRDDGSWWLVDGSGVMFGRTEDRPDDLPVLDAPGGDEAATTRAAGVAVLTSLPSQVHELVVKASAYSAADVRLELRSGATVLWGGPSGAAEKAAVLLALLGEDASTYDVSAPSRPAITP
jgi:cell division protein FtsQ